MKPTIAKDRTHCPKGHDLLIHGFYFGSSQRCRECNRQNAARLAALRRNATLQPEDSSNKQEHSD
ncbi:hypothetical protein [Silvibacterium dinghuense]|uniref:Uncharacterized protein n=1 Tax=Silvibacterium dinghuense TaxID=1560006 RepID=A0A4V1NVB4_9BACT|nr:hypothetical protein [Silvibacterium dinghuense]RXS95180.1 hypothetical protein ESZ00_11270 [Silvibacterium dinghuense]